MAAPGFTLTATLQTITGGAAGTTTYPAKLIIVLCGFGLAIPGVTGTSTIAQRKYVLLVSSSGQASQLLWGNDQITPAQTFYSITVVDGAGNILQTGNYELVGSGGDLSTLTPIVPYVPPVPSSLQYRSCTGAVPGTAYVAPGQTIAVTQNGVFLRPNIDYTVGGGVNITLVNATSAGDSVYALCLV
jgi:hypothetical protein